MNLVAYKSEIKDIGSVQDAVTLEFVGEALERYGLVTVLQMVANVMYDVAKHQSSEAIRTAWRKLSEVCNDSAIQNIQFRRDN